MSCSVVLLTGPGASGRIAYHALQDAVGEVHAIREAAPSRRTLVKRRLRRLGVQRVAGQLAFQTIVSPILSRVSGARSRAILDEAGLCTDPIPESRLHDVASVNDDYVPALIAKLEPAVIAVMGTRIIGKRVLAEIKLPIFNYHAGITPAYRGVHGGYWALASQDAKACGVTIHQVDEGIDTGAVCAQTIVRPSPEDNFATYPALQLAAGIPLLVEVLQSSLQGHVPSAASMRTESQLYYHPTIGEYLLTWFMYGVR